MLAPLTLSMSATFLASCTQRAADADGPETDLSSLPVEAVGRCLAPRTMREVGAPATVVCTAPRGDDCTACAEGPATNAAHSRARKSGADAPILRLDNDALAYIFALVMEAKSVRVTNHGKAKSRKNAFLAKLEFSTVCSRFKQVAFFAHSSFPWFWPCLWFEKEGEPTWLSDEGKFVRDPYIAERNRHFIGPLLPRVRALSNANVMSAGTSHILHDSEEGPMEWRNKYLLRRNAALEAAGFVY